MVTRCRPTSRLSLAQRRRHTWHHTLHSPAWWRGRTHDGVSAHMVAEYTLCGIIFDPSYTLFAAMGHVDSAYGTDHLYAHSVLDAWDGRDTGLDLTGMHQTCADEMMDMMEGGNWWTNEYRAVTVGGIEPYGSQTRYGRYRCDDQGLWRFL